MFLHDQADVVNFDHVFGIFLIFVMCKNLSIQSSRLNIINESEKMNSHSTTPSWNPTKLWEPLQIWTVVLANAKTAISSVASDWKDSYYGMDDLGPYARIILFSFIISIPFSVFRRKHIQVLTFLCTDIALAYYICTKAGQMVGIIAGLLMLMTTVVLTLIYNNQRQKLLCVPPKGKLQYCCYLLGWGVLAYFL